MTDEKLGALLTSKAGKGNFEFVGERFTIMQSYFSEFIKNHAYICTEEEAKKDFPQFRWVALDRL